MQAVILAAGKGTRLAPLTRTIPKTLLDVGGVRILERNLLCLPPAIKEIIIVIGHLGDQIKNSYGDNFKGKEIRYVEQDKLSGTAHALRLCRKMLEGRFLVLMGDNIYQRADIVKCLRRKRSILVWQNPIKFRGSEVAVGKNNNFISLRKVLDKRRALVNTGLYVLDTVFFKFKSVKLENGKESGLPHTLAANAKKYPLKIVRTKSWIEINDHKDLAKAKKFIKDY